MILYLTKVYPFWDFFQDLTVQRYVSRQKFASEDGYGSKVSKASLVVAVRSIRVSFFGGLGKRAFSSMS